MPRLFAADESPIHRYKLFTLTGAAGTSGVFGSLLNPFGQSVFIHKLIIDVTTQSTGASTLDAGPAADATTSNDTLIDGVSGATAGVLNSQKNAGTNGLGMVKWTAAQYLNVAEASGDVDGLVATVYAEVSFL